MLAFVLLEKKELFSQPVGMDSCGDINLCCSYYICRTKLNC